MLDNELPPNTLQKNDSVEKAQLKLFKDNSTVVDVFLISGIKLIGTVLNFDDTAIEFSVKDKDRTIQQVRTQLIYKHGIATVVPNLSR